MLEERDGFFSKLKDAIEKTAERCRSPVVIVAHSMGNRHVNPEATTRECSLPLPTFPRVLQYFLHMLVENEGEQGRGWIDQHIHSYVAVGAPFLGAPKIVRSLVLASPFCQRDRTFMISAHQATGERMGMEALLRSEEGIAFIRSLGAYSFCLRRVPRHTIESCGQEALE